MQQKCCESLGFPTFTEDTQNSLQGFQAACITAEGLEALLVPFPESPGLSCASQNCCPVRWVAVVHQTLELGALGKLISDALKLPRVGWQGGMIPNLSSDLKIN